MKKALYIAILLIPSAFAQADSAQYNLFPNGILEILETDPYESRSFTIGAPLCFYRGQYPSTAVSAGCTFGGSSMDAEDWYQTLMPGYATTTGGVIRIDINVMCQEEGKPEGCWLREGNTRYYSQFSTTSPNVWTTHIDQDFSLTKFYELNMANGTTTTSTTPLFFTGYLNLNEEDAPDILTNEYDIEIRIKRMQDDQLAVTCVALDACLTTFTIEEPLLNQGINVFSTTTTFYPYQGEYRVEWSLRRNSTWNSFVNFFSSIIGYDAALITSTTTYFVVDSYTAYDKIRQSMTEAYNYGFSSTTASTTLQKLDRCNPLNNFDMGLCMSGLFAIDSSQGEYLSQTVRSGILSRAPFAYVTRLVEIVASTSTSTLPTLAFTVATSSNGLEGSYSLNAESFYTQAGAYIDEFSSGDGLIVAEEDEGVWDVVMPFIEVLGYTGITLKIIMEVLQLSDRRRRYKHGVA